MKYLLLLLLISCDTSIQVYPSPHTNIVHVAGALRIFEDHKWNFIRDNLHEPINSKSVEVIDDHIRVNFTFTANKIGTLLVNVDEQYASLGMICGASIDLSYANIYCYVLNNGHMEKIRPEKMYMPGSNLFYSGDFEVKNNL